MVWQPGGLSHIDSYDPKPNSGSEYRGPFDLIDTKVPGLQFTELLPAQAAIADKFTVLRSMRQTAGGHPAGSMQLLSGDPDTAGQAEAQVPGLDDGRQLHACQRRPADQSAARPTSGSTRRSSTTARPTSATPTRRSSSPGTRNAPTFSVPNIGLTDAGERRASTAARISAGTSTRSSGAFDQQGSSPPSTSSKSQAMTLADEPEDQGGVRPQPRGRQGPRPLRPQRLGPAAAPGARPPRGSGGRRPDDEPQPARCAAGCRTGTTTR